MAQGQNFGKLPATTQILIVATGLTIVGTVAYLIYRNHKKHLGEKGKDQLAGNESLTNKGLESVVKDIPKNKIQDVKKALDKFDPKPIAELIYDAHGFWNDDEDQVYSAFGMIKNKAELSLISDYFQRAYGKGLFVYIQNFLSDTELARVNDIVKKLPTY